MIGVVSSVLLGALPALAADDVRSEIEAANEKWEAAVGGGDAPGAAALYTPDAQLLPNGSDVVEGTEAIAQFLRAMLDSGVEVASLVTIEVEGHGDTAWEVGKYEFQGADGKVLGHGKYVVIWKKQGGSWKLHRDVLTPSVVPAEQ